MYESTEYLFSINHSIVSCFLIIQAMLRFNHFHRRRTLEMISRLILCCPELAIHREPHCYATLLLGILR